jgi:FMN phosphatase YigB (HAD superfamily)
MKGRVILTDVDGCVLDWVTAFSAFMSARGNPELPGTERHYSLAVRYRISVTDARAAVHEFNTSEWMMRLTALRDAEEYVKRLHHDHGFVFHAITSISSDPIAYNYRWENLTNVFGKDVFQNLVCLELGSSKDNALSLYKDSGCLWVEDLPRNAVAGHNLGLRSVLIEHDYNSEHAHEDIPVVKTWKEIYEMVIS